jgi:hypothetical protein
METHSKIVEPLYILHENMNWVLVVCLNQLDVNKQSLIRAHCSRVTVEQITANKSEQYN